MMTRVRMTKDGVLAIGGSVCALGGAGAIGYWVVTLQDHHYKFWAWEGITAVALTVVGIGLLVAGSLMMTPDSGIVLHQSGSHHSQNVQAAHASNVVVNYNDVQSMREVALDVYRSNFLELQDVARDVALARAEKITTEFITRISEDLSLERERLADPDVQRSLYRAQSEYACSGEQDLGQVLTDLLVDRVREGERNLRTLALNEAIVTAPRLTIEQRTTLAVVFFVKHTRMAGLLPLEFYLASIRSTLGKLAPHFTEKRADFQHMASAGVGTLGAGEVGFEAAYRAQVPGYFTTGFDRDHVRANNALTYFADSTDLLMPCLRDDGKLQIKAMSPDDAQPLAEQIGAPESAHAIRDLMTTNLVSDHTLAADIAGASTAVSELIRGWNDGYAKYLDLTSTGIAIGHAYWQRVTGERADLAIWL